MTAGFRTEARDRCARTMFEARSTSALGMARAMMSPTGAIATLNPTARLMKIRARKTAPRQRTISSRDRLASSRLPRG